MTPGSATSFAAAIFCMVLAAAVVSRRRSMPAWWFAAGMVALAVESVFGGLSRAEFDPEELTRWHTWSLMAKAFVPFTWLAFSLTYLRGDYLRHLRQWRYALAAALIVPVGLVTGFREDLATVVAREGEWWIAYGIPAHFLNLAILIATILILTNLEKTLRAAVGTARWKIKFAMLGLGLIFGAQIYSRSQTLLFSGYDLNLTLVESSALLIGCVFLTVSLVRQGFGGIDIYPSRALLQSSVTVILVGGYLFVVGALAQLAAFTGGTGNFQFQTVVVLAGVAVLAVLLLSDRLQLRLRAFVGRHFNRPQHDARALWTASTHRLSSRTESRSYCVESVKLVAGTFQILSATVWLFDERRDCFSMGASTEEHTVESHEPLLCPAGIAPLLAGLQQAEGPFAMDRSKQPWVEAFDVVSQPRFKSGGSRLCLPLKAGGRLIGAFTLADRVNGVAYTIEELDLLRCIGDQVAAGLLQFQLSEELLQSRELEAFQTMSTFFIHDLKNTASSLGLMLKNLPVHFDDPEFRKDALRGIGTTVDRINQMIQRLGTLRQKLELCPVETDLNQLVRQAATGLDGMDGVELVCDLQPLPPLMVDRDHLESVVTNLLVNAREAMERGGKITLKTSLRDGRAVLSVADTGCGMSAAFIRNSLFRPFHSTKKRGLGIGMFQCRMIINAHRGSMLVESQPGQGTTFQILLPFKHQAS